MENKIIKNLKQLKKIEPDSEFVRQTRYLILGRNGSQSLSFGSAFNLKWYFLAPALLVFLVAVFSVKVLPAIQTREISERFTPNQLNSELQALNIDIQVKEISYRQNINQTIASVLDELVQPTPSDSIKK